MKKPVIIIPSYQPDHRLINLVNELTTDPNRKIIVVNDGSTGNSKDIFVLLKDKAQVEVLHHAKNIGKGQALKTAIEYFLTKYSHDYSGVVTVDEDGQHSIADIDKISKSLQNHRNTLILGIRKFNSEGVPLRSLIGNKITIFVFKLVTGIGLTDTQTGLRGIPTDFLYQLRNASEKGYDFELEMLIRAIENKLIIKEIPIETIYYESNKGSHFNSFWDSIKIYAVFLRHLLRPLNAVKKD
ncbi:MAG: glycosyltransferase family 2 protein [Anaerolineaceae bacterium]|nr:glycosyltransferase family 2 protein [Anaerolineaceae bacterium]